MGRGVARGERGGSAAKRSGGHRRNGMPAPTWMTIEPAVTGDTGRPQGRRQRGRRGVQRRSRRERARVGRGNVERLEQIPLVLDRVPRPQLARPRDAHRVHPARAATSYPRRPGAPLSHVNHDARGPPWKSIARSNAGARKRQPARDRRAGLAIRAPRSTITSSRCGFGDDRGRERLDEVGEPRGGKAFAQRTNGRRRQDDVADQAESDQEDPLR